MTSLGLGKDAEMAPLIALVGVALVLFVLGRLGVRPLRHWSVPLRGGLAAMFTLTGLAHFIGLREQLIAMVPPVLPAPGLLVTITGVLELAGVVGLLWHRTASAAGACLSLLLVAMFPANVYAILHGQAAGFTDQLVPRTLMQVVFLAATVAVFLGARRVSVPRTTVTA